jgi:hypothetical protein
LILLTTSNDTNSEQVCHALSRSLWTKQFRLYGLAIFTEALEMLHSRFILNK